MSDSKSTSDSNTFTKRSHRPWKPTLLEDAIQATPAATTLTPSIDDLLPSTQSPEFSPRLSNEPLNPTEPEHEPNQTATRVAEVEPVSPPASEATQPVTQQSFANSPHNEGQLNSIYQSLQSAIQEKNRQKDQIVHEISDRTSSPMLIGGFLQPGQIDVQEPSDSPNGKKISALMLDLKSKEQELSALTNNLKIAQAIEHAEQAELSRQAELQGRKAAEGRMQEAISQANLATDQLRIAMEQAQQAEVAQKAEEALRHQAESEIQAAHQLAQQAHTTLEQERQARAKAEEKSQHALNQTVQTELARQQLEDSKRATDKALQETLEKLRQSELAREAEAAGRNEAETRLADIENSSQGTQQAFQTLQDRFSVLEREHKEVQAKMALTEDKLLETLEKIEKSQDIIESERQLRTIAERRAKEARALAARAEAARKAEMEQSKLIQERAQRAVSHASRTVMHFLNAPIDDSTAYQGPHPTKPSKAKATQSE